MNEQHRLRQKIHELLFDELNANFRDFHAVGVHWFPEDEFSHDERECLVRLCARVEKCGYRLVRNYARTERGQFELDLISSHLCFLDDSVDMSILGIAIASEMSLVPVADACYASGLDRATCFLRLGAEQQSYIVGLFHLARYCRGLAAPSEIQVFKFLERISFDASPCSGNDQES